MFARQLRLTGSNEVLVFFQTVSCTLLLTAASAYGAEPLKGIVLWPDMARERPDLSAEVSLEFSYCLPCDVASEPGRYDWRKIEDLLTDIASRGHQAIIRFRYVYPGEKLGGVRGATAVPKFIKNRGDYRETFAKNPDGDGPTWYPDWSCKALEDFTLDFYEAFAKKYDSDPRLAYVQAGFGHWAEYHTSGTKTKPGVNFPSIDFQRRFFALMEREFRKTPWMVSIDSAGRDGDWSPAVDLARHGVVFGLFDDSLMSREHPKWNALNWSAFGEDHWKKAPRGGEISYYEKGDQRNFLSPKGVHGSTWAATAKKFHLAFVIANDAPEGKYATPERFAVAAHECGWRFVVKGWRVTQHGVEVMIGNEGVAPICHDVGIAIGGKRGEGTLKGLLPGETRVFVVKDCASPKDVLTLVSEKLLFPVLLK